MTRHPAPLVRRLVRFWRDVDYAQRRIFEIQTGLPPTRHFERH